MLEELRIRCLGVIADAVVEFAPGLTVVTGETGAGKTMVVSGLSLLLGGRADAGQVRSGEARASVEGRLLIAGGGVVAQRVEELGGDLDGETVLIGRTVGADGRSRAQLGGRGVPIAVLSELADEMIAIHGQHDQQRLLSTSRQREALDRFAGDAVDVPLHQYRAAFERHREVLNALSALAAQTRERARELDALRFGCQEIEAVGPRPGEDEQLRTEVARLAHAESLRSAAGAAHDALVGDGSDVSGATDLIAAGRAALDRESQHDPVLVALGERIAEAGYLLADAAGDLASYLAGLDLDPARLAVAQDRQAALASLTRKYGEDLDAVLAWARDAAERIAELDSHEERTDALERERVELLSRMRESAEQVSAARSAAAARLGAAVTAELHDLAMPHAEVIAAVTRREAFGPHGVDDVELLLAANPGAPARSLAKAASGGELSRVMLAVEVVFAGADPVPTFVFDEVDAGVGGKAAVEIGRRLARLARTAQVVVVTHLPQVAAFADHHLVVVKSDDGMVTRSGVVALEGDERVRELSRMLAGQEGSEAAQAHAAELLAAADAFRADA